MYSLDAFDEFSATPTDSFNSRTGPGQFRVALDKFTEDAIIERHEANKVMFDAFFAKPESR